MNRPIARSCRGVICFLILATLGLDQARAEEPDRLAVAVEALHRLKGANLATNAALKSLVDRVLAATQGTPDFVSLVRDFGLTGQNAGLFAMAVTHPGEEAGVEAMRLLLAGGDMSLPAAALAGTNLTAAGATVLALGNTADRRAVPLLLLLVTDDQLDPALRTQAVRSLAQTQDGANALLKLARDDTLPNQLRSFTGGELNRVRWPDIKAAAAELLPPPQSRDAQPLPPIPELMKLPGDARRGEAVYGRSESTCVTCHRVNDKGADVGPALSEIGTKLAPEALFESMLHPSAGISHGFEAWLIETRSGDDLVGVIVSETADELVLKDARNIPVRVRKADLTRREKSTLSLMPAGLQQTMSQQDLVDLVAYLLSLKKVAP